MSDLLNIESSLSSESDEKLLDVVPSSIRFQGYLGHFSAQAQKIKKNIKENSL